MDGRPSEGRVGSAMRQSGADGPDQLGRSVLETSSDVEERPSFHAVTVSPQFDSHTAGAVPREVGWRQGWRRATFESVGPRACNVVAQTKRSRQHRSS